MECPLCGGDGCELGALGNRSHFRCQDCGMNFSSLQEKELTMNPKPTAQDLVNYQYDVRTSPFFSKPETFLALGQRVRAKFRIFDSPNPGRSDDWGWVSADAGEEGTVVGVEPGYWPTVRFDKTGCATCVTDHEVEVMS